MLQIICVCLIVLPLADWAYCLVEGHVFYPVDYVVLIFRVVAMVCTAQSTVVNNLQQITIYSRQQSTVDSDLQQIAIYSRQQSTVDSNLQQIAIYSRQQSTVDCYLLQLIYSSNLQQSIYRVNLLQQSIQSQLIYSS